MQPNKQKWRCTNNATQISTFVIPTQESQQEFKTYVFIDGVVLLHLQGTRKVFTSTMLILSNVWHQNASQKPLCALGYTSKILCLQMA
jgi:hypothetical protein